MGTADMKDCADHAIIVQIIVPLTKFITRVSPSVRILVIIGAMRIDLAPWLVNQGACVDQGLLRTPSMTSVLRNGFVPDVSSIYKKLNMQKQ